MNKEVDDLNKIINLCTDIPELEEDPVFEVESPLFKSVKPIYNKNLLPRFDGSVFIYIFLLGS